MMCRLVACIWDNTTHACCSNDCNIIADHLIESMMDTFCKIGLSDFTKLVSKLNDSTKQVMKQAKDKENRSIYRGACTDAQCAIRKNKKSNDHVVNHFVQRASHGQRCQMLRKKIGTSE